MGGFPALPSGNNPSVGAASGYASAAASVYNSLQSRLQQAAAQHATLLRNKQVDEQTANQRDFENQLQLQKSGAIPQNLPQLGDRGTGHDGVTLQRPESNPAVPENGKGQTITTPRGDKYYAPTEQEQGKSFVPTGGLAGALTSAGWDGKTAITPAASHQILQALEAAQPKDEAYDIDTSGKFLDGQGNPTPVMIGRKTGKITMLGGGQGAQTPTAQPSNAATPAGAGAPGGPFTATPDQPVQPTATPTQPSATSATSATPSTGVRFALPDKTDQQSVVPGKKGPKGGMVVWDKKTGKTSEVPYPEGTTDELTAGQKEADKDRHTRMAEAATRGAEVEEGRSARINTQLTGFNKELTDRKQKALAALKKASADAVTDEDKTGAARDYKEEMRQAQTEYETNIGTALRKPIAHNDWADKLPDGATPPKTATPAKTPAAPAAAPAKGQRTAPPVSVTKDLQPGTHTFGNGQTWKKNRDGSMVYVSGGQ